MPDLVEHMYCSQQINIPTQFPYILKQYAKAAIRTQPYDLLRWTVAYFTAMANGQVPPIKDHFEYAPLDAPSGLTPGYLRVLLKQFGEREVVSKTELFDRWFGVSLNEESLREILEIGGFEEHVNWLHFVAIAAGHLTNSLGETMLLLCELLTVEPEGGSAMIPCVVFNDLYAYLALLECGPPKEAGETPQSSTTDLGTDATPLTPADSRDNMMSRVKRKDSVESVGEEPPLHPLVYFRPSGKHSSDDVNEMLGKPDDEQVLDKDPEESRILGKDPRVYEHLISTVQDDETQTSTHGVRINVKPVPGIGPRLPNDQISAVLKYMEWWAERQEGMAMPRNIRHFLCPPLDKLPLPERCTTQYHYPNTNILP